MMNKKSTSFSSNVSKRYRADDDKVSVTLDFSEDELDNLTKLFTRMKKSGETKAHLIEDFLAEVVEKSIKMEFGE